MGRYDTLTADLDAPPTPPTKYDALTADLDAPPPPRDPAAVRLPANPLLPSELQAPTRPNPTPGEVADYESIRDELTKGGAQANPWVDPISAGVAAATGGTASALNAGASLTTALGRGAISGLTNAALDVPVGAATEMVAKDHPNLALPFNIAAGVAGGMAVDRGISALTRRAPTVKPPPVAAPPEKTLPQLAQDAIVPRVAPAPLPVPRSPSGIEPPTAATPPLRTPRVSTPNTGAIAREAANEATALANTTAARTDQRLYHRVAEALQRGEIEVDRLPDLLQREGMSLPQFVSQYAETIAESGRTLQQLSTLRKALDRLATTNPEAQAALSRLEPLMEPTAWNAIKRAYTTIDNVRRASLVTQVATTMRNIESQTGRYSLDALDQSLQQVLLGKPVPEAAHTALEHAATLFRTLKPAEFKRIGTLLDHFPLDAARLSSTPVGELTLHTRYAQLINTLNTTQETFFRRAVFDQTLRTGLRAAGMNVQESLANPRLIPEDLVTKSVDNALEMTFAALPKKGTFSSAILDTYRAVPMLTTINPFPRFLTNSYKFLIDFNPTGIFRLMMRDANGVRLGANPAARAQILSRAALGTTMLAGALGLRYSPMAGEKWYELNVNGRRWDMRPFAPFSTYLYAAEFMKQTADLGEPSRMTIQDHVQGMLSINRIAGTGLVALDLIREGTLDRKLELMKDMVGQYLGGFTVPFRTLKDIITAANPAEGLTRESGEGIADPAISNIPGLSRRLPEKPSPLRATTPTTETPLMRQFTGLRGVTPRATEAEVNRLGIEWSRIASRTGLPAVDRAINAAMGQIVERQLDPQLTSDTWAQVPERLKPLVLTRLLAAARAEAVKEVKRTHPDYRAALTLQQQSPDVRNLLTIPDVIKSLTRSP